MRKFRLVIIGFVLSMFVACSSDDDNNFSPTDPEDSISDEPFSGTVNGESFTVEASNGEITFEGFVDGEFVENDGIEKLDFELSNIEFDCGADISGVATRVFGKVETGTIGFQLTDISTNIPGQGTDTQSGGLVELVSITDTEAVIKIKTASTISDAYSLEGKFTVAICPIAVMEQ